MICVALLYFPQVCNEVPRQECSQVVFHIKRTIFDLNDDDDYDETAFKLSQYLQLFWLNLTNTDRFV